VTFRVSNGTATGCAITGSSLAVTKAGTCIVIATQAANGTNAAVSSSATTISFAPKVSTASPVAITVSFAAKSNALSAEAKKALRALATKLVAGASVTITGFAKGDSVLAKSRAKTVANYLASLVKIQVTLKSVTGVAAERATLTSTNR
jgi:outer membrane protein OmpA-like peptidoglycan-associated protein